MRETIRAFGWMSGAMVIIFGLFAFVHDSLGAVQVLDPFSDEHTGIIAGPIFMLIGASVILGLFNSLPVLD